MSPDKMRISIAEASGWKQMNETGPWNWFDPIGNIARVEQLPDFLHDLNAMHEVAMSLRLSSPLKYVHYAAAITAIVAKHNSDLEDDFSISAHDATAAQRAEAFLRTICKWEDDPQQQSPTHDDSQAK